MTSVAKVVEDSERVCVTTRTFDAGKAGAERVTVSDWEVLLEEEAAEEGGDEGVGIDLEGQGDEVVGISQEHGRSSLVMTRTRVSARRLFARKPIGGSFRRVLASLRVPGMFKNVSIVGPTTRRSF